MNNRIPSFHATKNPRDRRRLGSLLALGAAATLLGCGEVGGDATETVRSELGDFGPWVSTGGPTLVFSPALAKGRNTTLTAFGWGTDHQIWTTAQNASGQWTGVWTALPGGTSFGGRVAAVALDVPSGPLVDHFAIVAMRMDSPNFNNYYIRIQNQSGSDVVKDWEVMPAPVFGGGWFSAPALAFIPASDSTDPDSRLIWAGLGYNGHYAFDRKLTNNQYGSGNPTCHGLDYLNGVYEDGTDIEGRSAPALAFFPPTIKGQRYLAMAMGVKGDEYGHVAYKTTFSTPTWCDPNGGWNLATDVPNGLFMSGPALAVTKRSGLSEMTLYGLGLDSRIYATYPFVANTTFFQVSPQTFEGPPGALGVGGGTVIVSALMNGNAYTDSDKYYRYQVYQFDDRTSWGYQGAGDWAYGEFKGGCAANEWSMGVSASAVNSSRAHSLLCASAAPGSPTSFTSGLHTLNISAANDGYGTHVNYDWDLGFYKGECAPNEVVVGLSQSTSTGALLHVRCAAAGATAKNCRGVIGDNQESPANPTDWASGYRKTACGKGRAVAGVSRGTVTGGVHAVLCCDFAGL
jgi:hypothetical protein